MNEPAREISVGLIGLGTVGTGVVRLLADNADRIRDRLGTHLRVRRIAVRDLARQRSAAVDRTLLTDNVGDVLDDPDIDVVVELVGGGDVVRDYLLRAIANNKHVVTANKALLANYGESLINAAAHQGVDLYFEASVGAGIPIIRSIREALASDRVRALYGIINGTTNYILTQMSDHGDDFHRVLHRAIDGGYAEADPSLDVDGIDAGQKLAILAALTFGVHITAADIPIEGIRSITPFDIAVADELGYVVKLLAIAAEQDGGVAARVHPALVPKGNLLSHVSGVYNAVLLHCEAAGLQLFYGKGAGMMPTASAVVSDIIEVSRNILQGRHTRIPGFGYQEERRQMPALLPPSKTRSHFFFHFEAVDRPGVLGQIASILGEHQISIAEMKQLGRSRDKGVPIFMLTHDAIEGDVLAALERIDAIDVTVSQSRFIRVVAPEVTE